MNHPLPEDAAYMQGREAPRQASEPCTECLAAPGRCGNCSGKGCEQCAGTGACPECSIDDDEYTILLARWQAEEEASYRESLAERGLLRFYNEAKRREAAEDDGDRQLHAIRDGEDY